MYDKSLICSNQNNTLSISILQERKKEIQCDVDECRKCPTVRS